MQHFSTCCTDFFCFESHLRLGNSNGLASHETAVDHEQKNGGVKLKGRTLEPDTEGKVIMNPTLREPVGHDGVHTERSGDRRSLKKLALAGRIFGEDGDGHIETGEASETAKHKEGKTNGIGKRAETESEGHHGGGNTKRDLNGTRLEMSSCLGISKRTKSARESSS